MPDVNPDDLLIFKKRGLKTEKEAAKDAAPTLPTSIPEVQVREEALPEEQPVYTAETIAADQRAKEETARRLGRRGKENIKASKGLKCANHPYRNAYAICEYCKRPFCYADLVSYGNNLYCIEDIDKVSRGTGAARGRSAFAYLSSLLFISESAVLSYFAYPQFDFLLKHIYAVGITQFVLTLNYNYAVLTANILLAALGLVSSAIVLVKSGKASFVSGLIAGLLLIVLSYEYLNSNVEYLLALSVLSCVNIGAIAISRMSYAGSKEIAEAEEEEMMDIEWPRVETF